MTDEQEKILERCKDVFQTWVARDFESDCTKIIEKNNVQNVNDNYLDAYPIVAAILMDNAADALNSSFSDTVRRKQKRLAHKYMKYRVKSL